MIKYKIVHNSNFHDSVSFQITQQPESFHSIVRLGEINESRMFPNLVIISSARPDFLQRRNLSSILYIRGYMCEADWDFILIPIDYIYIVISALDKLNDIYMEIINGGGVEL